MMPCNEIGSKIAHGFPLSAQESQHVTGCDACAAALASFVELDALLGEAGLDAPAGFADRVMAHIAAGSSEEPWFERRSVQLLFAHAGALAAAVNVLFFVASVFLATPSLGGTP